MLGTDIIIVGPDGSFGAYFATAHGGRGPGLVVLQEMYGVNGFMRHTCDAYAEQGFFALCPDLYWRQRPGVQLSDASQAGLDQAFKLMAGLDCDKAIVDIKTVIEYLRAVPGGNGRVAAIGFCLGGLLAYLTAARTDIDATVGYYGVDVHKYLAEKSLIRKPLMLHIAEEDTALPKEDNAAIKRGLAGHPLVTIHSYPGLDHAFARVDTKYFKYDARAADLANGRTLKLLNEALMNRSSI